MVAKGRRLGRLQMGEARHQRVSIGLGLGHEGALQGHDLCGGPVAAVTHPEPKIEGDLIIARAGRVQTASRWTDQFAKARLHIHVDVFKFLTEGKGAARDFRFDLRQAVLNCGLISA